MVETHDPRHPVIISLSHFQSATLIQKQFSFKNEIPGNVPATHMVKYDIHLELY